MIKRVFLFSNPLCIFLLQKAKMISETIKTRRAVFPAQYNNQPITKDEIRNVLEAANWAPTHKKTEPWRFKVFQGASKERLANFLAETYKNKTETFSEFTYKKYQENPKKAACIIAICMQRNLREVIPEWEEIAAVSCAVQNLMLSAHERGLGAYWSSPPVACGGEFTRWLGLEGTHRMMGLVYLGWPQSDQLPPPSTRGDLLDRVTWHDA